MRGSAAQCGIRNNEKFINWESRHDRSEIL